jgi:uncharacterized protein YndB with AHSA1/START domain
MSIEFRRTGATSGELSFSTPRAPEEVYAYLADFQRHKEWTSEIVSQEQTSDGPAGVGTTYRTVEAMREGSRMKAPTTCEITALEPPRRIEWKARTGASHGPMAMRSQWTFEIVPEGAGSRVTQRFRFDPPDVFGAAFMRIFVPIADGVFGGLGASPKNIRKHGEKLAEILNADSAGTPAAAAETSS